MDTIFALATARGRSGVAIVRVSGQMAFEAGSKLSGDLPKSRGLRSLIDPVSGDLLDEALVLVFAKGQSFTGEQVVEFHLHGSIAIQSRVLRSLGSMDGLRHAEAGEFTRRALDNGCLDLAQVEGLADLIDAETETQHKQALRVFSGRLGDLAEEWRKKLIRAASLIEATIDFADEDVPTDVGPEVSEILEHVGNALKLEAEGSRAAERIRNGFEVAIVGSPNVGKSTLLNHLAGRPAALTSDIPGTTRDVIEVRMEIGGYAVTLLDTAGVRQTSDEVEELGVALALKRAMQADLRIFLTNRDLPTGITPLKNDIVVRGKADLDDTPEDAVSGKTGQGVDKLLNAVSKQLDELVEGAGLAIRERHRLAMLDGIGHIEQARLSLESGLGLDIAAAELRFALQSVDSIVGRVDVEDLLDEIFLSFCIGK